MFKYSFMHINEIPRRPIHLLTYFIILALLALFFYQNPASQESVMSSDHATAGNSLVNCSHFGFGYLETKKRPIYDFFIFDHELDMLEIRLYELYDHVTLFLIAESATTFSGKSKPLYLKENWARYAKYHDKMRRIEVNLKGMLINQSEAWENEHNMREIGIRSLLPKEASSFILLTADADEIPKSRFVQALQACKLPKPFPSLRLRCDFYYYSFEFRHASRDYWDGGTASYCHTARDLPRRLRLERHKYKPMMDACFHCSYCFDRISLVREKLSSFSHTELDIDKYRSTEHIVNAYRYGKDLFDRQDESLRFVKITDIELPNILRVEQEKFAYMLNRSLASNVGFQDFLTQEV